MKISVLLIDDHAVVREGYRRQLERDDNLAVVREASSIGEALPLDSESQPQVVVLDIAFPGVSGIEVLRRLIAHRLGTRVLMFSPYKDGIYAAHAMHGSAYGYLSKASAPDLLVQAALAVAGGPR